MVRKRIPHVRARRGIIPTNDPAKDRARTVHALLKIFKDDLDKNQRISMANTAKEILVIGESDAIFSGKDPLVSGIAIFIYVCRRFSYDCNCPITYDEIREKFVHFAAGYTFVGMLKTLSKKFGEIEFKNTTSLRKRRTLYSKS
ncbi:MAG: hypothetical protein ACREAK_04255 [Nitrosarchaeum sp.]